ncbi:CocE/NonD family hydrolase [Gemmatimonas sp. UBA7669]|uniref:CocE/NonD family hydrolase n=2 Tax=Bacteria TaxID=2 RepID=UPI0025C28192|nr:CocE/NonD family hydrolase [Gemmatimonas sp. UBA7669]
MRLSRLLLAGLCAAPLPVRPSLLAQTAPAAYQLTEAMVPMRDGVKLYTRILAPRVVDAPLPLLLVRTPYGIDFQTPQSVAAGWTFMAGGPEQVSRRGYIHVFQDVRGKFRSEGEFVMLRPLRTNRADSTQVDESTDAYDTIAWLLRHVPQHNGRVGMTGVSYPGWLTVQAMLDPHPALKAASPQASPADMWLGDDFRHNGAFRLSYGFEYATMMESGKDVQQFRMDTYDSFDWYLRLGPLSNVNAQHLKGRIPTWNDFVAHPDYDAFWKRQSVTPRLNRVDVPTLHVAGWWDQEDFYGPITIYRALEQHDRAQSNRLVVGPWNHGGWMRGSGESLGPIQFGQPTAQWFRDSVMAPFFAAHLHDAPDPRLPEALIFEAGSNVWKRYDSWPVKTGVSPRSLYLREGSALAWEPPTQRARAFDSYVSDPAKPVPYRPRPIPMTYGAGSTWSTWLTDDQRFAHLRPDVLSWTLPALEQDLTIAGDLTVTLHAATTGTDADWVVKLIDVYPDTGMQPPRMNGYQFMVANEVFRGRYRTSFEKPAPIVPGTPQPYTIDLHTQAYTFRKGHRVMIQVQSSWFPLIDRNPQTFVPNIFEAKASDFRAATQQIHRSAAHPSRIVLPVVTHIRP